MRPDVACSIARSGTDGNFAGPCADTCGAAYSCILPGEYTAIDASADDQSLAEGSAPVCPVEATPVQVQCVTHETCG